MLGGSAGVCALTTARTKVSATAAPAAGRTRAGLGRSLGVWALLGVLAWAAGAGCSGDRARHPFFDRAARDGGPLVFAHRGGGGLAPEATLPTLLAAHHTWGQVVEFDLHQSRDGHLVVIHDATVDRTTNGRGAVSELSLAELQALDAGFCTLPGQGDGTALDCRDPAQTARFPFRGQGYRIPTLDEVLAQLPQTAFIGIEIKGAGFEARFAALMRASGRLDHIVVGSEDDDVAERLKDLLPEVPHYMPRAAATCFALAAKASFGYPCPEYDLFASPLQGAGLALDTEGVLEAAHRLGMVVVYWTINDQATAERLFRLGADGVFSDYPDRAQAARDRHLGKPSAPP